MIPQIGTVPSGGPGLQNATNPGEARTPTGRFEAPVVRSETALAVDPPQKAAEIPALTRELRRNLNPPDPNAPAGPSPSFEASILDRAMEELKSPPPPPDPELEAVVVDAVALDESTNTQTDAEAEPAVIVADAPDTGGSDTRAADPYAVPPTADVRAEREVSEIRQIQTAPEPGSLDVEI